MIRILFISLSLTFLCIATGCTSIQPGTTSHWIVFTESGQASFYADQHQGRKTASGEIYKTELKTAAHRRLPLGSYVKVTNINNGKSVIVKINDRGPYAKDRIIDLSKSAFSSIGNPSLGVINVKIEVVQ